MIQSDPAIVHELQRMVTTQTVVAVALAIVALSALGVAVAAIFAIRKLTGMVDRTMAQLKPKLDPLLTSANRIAGDAEDVAATAKVRLNDVLGTVEEITDRLKTGAQAVEERVRQFGTVVDVVQGEAEELLLDAASTARGVHAAAQMLRSGRPARPDAEDDTEDYDAEEDEFTD